MDEYFISYPGIVGSSEEAYECRCLYAHVVFMLDKEMPEAARSHPRMDITECGIVDEDPQL
jgi:hypothetical protein